MFRFHRAIGAVAGPPAGDREGCRSWATPFHLDQLALITGCAVRGSEAPVGALSVSCG